MLTDSQLPTLKAAILAETDPAFVAARQAGATGAMAEWFNVIASPAVPLWRRDAPVVSILNAIDWAKYTPSDALDGTAALTNRLLVIQTKQMNLQSMLVGRLTVDATLANIRAGLRDATIQVPAGAGGANVTPGGANAVDTLTACTRSATRGEKLFAPAGVQTGAVTASVPGFEGAINDGDIVLALAA